MFRKSYNLDESCYLTKKDIDKIIEAGETPEDKLLMKCLFFTGSRISEIVGKDGVHPLIPRRIDWENNRVVLRNLKSKKGNIRWKTLNPPEFLLKELKDYIDLNNIGKNEPIIKMTRFVAYYRVRKAGERAGIEIVGQGRLKLRTFRHSFVMHGVINDVPRIFLRKQTGHQTDEMLSKYESLKPSDIERDKKKMWDNGHKQSDQNQTQ